MKNTMGYERPRYTDYEISFMVRSKVQSEKMSIDKFVAEYDVSTSYMDIILSGENHLSKRMLDIASEILEMDYDELVVIDVDSNETSCRQSTSEDKSDFFDMLNYVFGEVIMQRKMAIE